MPSIQRRVELLVRHFAIGDYIEHSWFRGSVVGINANALTQHVRVAEVLRPAPNRSIGSVQRVPFNCGHECQPGNERNVRQSANVATNERILLQPCVQLDNVGNEG